MDLVTDGEGHPYRSWFADCGDSLRSLDRQRANCAGRTLRGTRTPGRDRELHALPFAGQVDFGNQLPQLPHRAPLPDRRGQRVSCRD
jgi:hypothetical protein